MHLHDDTLSALAISGLDLPHAELAYLSACSTADRGIAGNEAITLASAFHAAGFPHVVATLWPLDDAVAVEAVRGFYHHLAGNADEAAPALHRVVTDLRDRYPDRPDLWACLVHSGR